MRLFTLAAAAAALAACSSDGPADAGDPPQAGLAITALVTATDPSAMRALSRAEQVHVVVASDSAVLLDRSLTGSMTGALQELSVPLTAQQERVTVQVSLQNGAGEIFAGRATPVALVRGARAAVEVRMEPVISRIVVDSIGRIDLYDTVPVSGAALFVTGDSIVGTPLRWVVPYESYFDQPLLHVVPGTPARVYGHREGVSRLIATDMAIRLDGVQRVTVRSRLVSFTLSPDTLRLEPGDTARFRSYPRDRRGTVLSRYTTWSSADTLVAVVKPYLNSSGEVIARAPGTTTVQARLMDWEPADPGASLISSAVVIVQSPAASPASPR